MKKIYNVGGRICLGVLSFVIASGLLTACGGDEKDNDVPADIDSGITEYDAGEPGCGEGLHDNGIGECVAEGCAENYHDGGAGNCVAKGSCSDGYAADGEGECTLQFISIPAGSIKGPFRISAVTVNAFALKKTPVTLAEFKKCVYAGACRPQNYKVWVNMDSSLHFCNYGRGDAWKNHPMNCVNWYGAKEYCEWIGGRLPTEEEWECASTHNGTEHLDTKYAFGDTLEHCVNANYSVWNSNTPSMPALYCDGLSESNSKVGTSAVGTYSPAGDSPLGLVDMTGNVDEWTASVSYSDSGKYTVIGGSWSDYENIAVYQYRSDPADFTFPSSGFRCAK